MSIQPRVVYSIVTLVGDSMMAIIEGPDMAHPYQALYIMTDIIGGPDIAHHYQALYIIPRRHMER